MCEHPNSMNVYYEVKIHFLGGINQYKTSSFFQIK